MSKSIRQSRITLIGVLLAVVLGVGAMSTARATYNSNIVGTLTSVIVYENGSVLFVLDAQPASNGTCDARYFEIDQADSSDAVVDRMYKRLLTAYTQRQPVQIGFDNSGACGSLGYIHTYRVG